MSAKPARKKSKASCGLCGSSKKKLTKTPCCNNWICDDEDSYVLFSYKRNSCYRNHDRFTLCSGHFEENHEGKWQDCQKCKDSIGTPQYVDMGTNKYNFEVLKNPERFSILCVNCGGAADTLNAFAVWGSKGYYCIKKNCQKAAFSR